MPGLPFFSIFGGFSFVFVAPCRRLAYVVYLVSHCFWRRLSCYAFMFPDFSNYSHCFNNLLNSFQYYILQSYTLHHYYAFTLYIPIIHNFFLYHTLFTFISIIHSIIFSFILLVHFCTVSCFYICSIGTIMQGYYYLSSTIVYDVSRRSSLSFL